MRESEKLKGNGSADRTEPPLEDPVSIGEHGRKIHHDAAALASEVQGTAADLERYLVDQVQRRPFTTLGAAAGIGYILGGGLTARLTVVMLGAATRFATAIAAREVSNRILQSGSATTRAGAPEPMSGASRERS